MNQKTIKLVRTETRLHPLVPFLAPYTVELVDERNLDSGVQSESLGSGIELRILDACDTMERREKIISKHGWAIEPPRLERWNLFAYRTTFQVYRNGVPEKFNIHGVEISELKVSTALWLGKNKDYGETKLFIDAGYSQSPAELSRYERIHFTPYFMYKGTIGMDYHVEVRDKLHGIVIKNLLSSN